MIKAILGSLLCGGAAVLAGIYLYFFATAPAPPLAARDFDFASAQVKLGEAVPGGDGQLTLNDGGDGVLLWTDLQLPARDFPLLELALRSPGADAVPVLLWKRTDTADQLFRYRLPGDTATRSRWSLPPSPDWQGTIRGLGILIEGQPGARVELGDMRLLPATPANQLKRMVAEWSVVEPWRHASINQHTAMVSGKGSHMLYPLPAIALWLVCSLLAYWLFAARSRRHRFDWRVVAGIFLACWLLTDLLWQDQLYGRLKVTRATFAALDQGEKHTVGIDTALSRFVSRAMGYLKPEEKRVFVCSRSDYAGMRSAYFVYPRNVYWKRRGPELPPRQFIHPGDHILVVSPSELKFDPQRQQLITPDGEDVDVKLVYSDAAGGLFRVL